jgi:Ca2+-binding EF-hand superfamily protein
MTPKGKEVGRQGSRPTEELVDYQLLRLKFLLNKAVGQKVDPLEVFQHFDTDGSGGIDTEEFTNGLQRLGIYLTEAEYTALLNRFLDADGTIPYQRFLGVLGLENGGPQTSSEPFKDSPSAVSTQALVSDELDKILKKIHEEIQTLADRGSGRKPNFKKAFAHFDKDGGGEIDLAEFMVGLSDIGIELKAKQMSQIAKVFDSDGQGTIDYEEFAKFSEAPSATEAVQHTKVFVAKKQKAASKSKFSEFELVDMVQNIHKEINRLARTKGKTPNFKAVFSEMDHDGGGKVDISEFLEGLGNLGFDLSLKQAVQVAQVFDSDGTGSIEAGEFVAFCEVSDVAEAVRISKTLKEKRKKTKRVPKKPHEKKPPKPVDTVALTKTVKNIHEEINRLAKSKYGTPDFRKVFAGMDHDGGGQLETTEFLEGLAEMGFIMKLKQVAQISAIFDSQGDGTVDYKEFVAFCEAKDAVEIMVQVEKRSKNRK